jgi:hypothetical protein
MRCASSGSFTYRQSIEIALFIADRSFERSPRLLALKETESLARSQGRSRSRTAHRCFIGKPRKPCCRHGMKAPLVVLACRHGQQQIMRLLIVPIGKLAQICNVVVRTQSSEIRDVFGRWLTAACAAGVRFVVLEGLMRSGKSCLTEQPFALGMSQSVNIELDGFLRKPAAGTALHRRFTDAR